MNRKEQSYVKFSHQPLLDGEFTVRFKKNQILIPTSAIVRMQSESVRKQCHTLPVGILAHTVYIGTFCDTKMPTAEDGRPTAAEKMDQRVQRERQHSTGENAEAEQEGE
jgi:hypothetical protein